MRLRFPGALLVAATAFLLAWFKVIDYDVFWHLKTGEVILDTGRLVRTNLFSSLFPDHPWPNPEWFFQVLLALAYRAGGWFAVQVLKVLLVAALGMALYAALLRRGLRPLAAAAFALVPLSLMQYRFTERPQLFSYLFFVLALLLADHARRGSRRALWLLLPLFALWSNIHPEVFLGLLYLGAIAAGEFLNARRAGGERAETAPRFAAATAGCAAATLLNPEGYHVLAFPFLHLFLGPTVEVTEYGPSTFADVPLFWILLLATIPLLVLRKARRDWAEILPVAGLGLLGVLYQRDTPYFLLAAAPALAGFIPAEERPGAWFTPRRAGLATFLAAAVALLWAIGLDRLQPYRWGWGIDERFYPVAAADALLAHPWRGRLYNHYNEGGYLIYRLHPRLGVFQDGRVQAYPRDFIARANARFSAAAWPGIVTDYQVGLALVKLSEAGPPYFNIRDWGIVFWDDDWCLLARRGSADADLMARLEYRVFLPGTAIGRISDPAALGRLAEEMARNQGERLQPSAALAEALAAVRRRLAGAGPPPGVR